MRRQPTEIPLGRKKIDARQGEENEIKQRKLVILRMRTKKKKESVAYCSIYIYILYCLMNNRINKVKNNI